MVLSDIDALETKSSVTLDMSGKRYMELSIVSYTGTARGALLISFTTQTLSITPSLYYIGIAVGEFTEPIALSGDAVGAAIEAVTRSSDKAKLYFQCPVNTWAAPIIIPLIGESSKVKYSARWLDSIPN